VIHIDLLDGMLGSEPTLHEHERHGVSHSACISCQTRSTLHAECQKCALAQ
jgi:hypothetical protein